MHCTQEIVFQENLSRIDSPVFTQRRSCVSFLILCLLTRGPLLAGSMKLCTVSLSVFELQLFPNQHTSKQKLYCQTDSV